MPPSPPSGKPTYQVAIVCSGMDRVRRGFEAYARELFELLKHDEEIDYTLIKGSGVRRPDEKVIGNLGRGTPLNRLLAFLCRKHQFFVEFISFDLCLIPFLLTHRYDVMYVLEPSVYKFLVKWRKLTRGRFKLVHSTDGHLANIGPGFVTANEYVHHLTPVYFDTANRLGFRKENQFLMPHFFTLEAEVAKCRNPEVSQQVRAELGLTPETKVVLSVGSIDALVKRMDYVVREVATLDAPVFLLIIGQRDHETPQIEALAAQMLGETRCKIMTVPRSAIFRYYQVADVFVLASFKEGFPLVFLEALAFGLPIIAHDYDVPRYILDRHGFYADLSKPGELARTLRAVLATDEAESERARAERMAYGRESYGVDRLQQSYQAMIRTVCEAAFKPEAAKQI